MKTLAALLLMLISSFVNAQCLMTAQGATESGYIRVCKVVASGACDNTTAYWAAYNASTPFLTADTIDTCTGHWISTASDVRNVQAVEVTPEGFLQAFTFGLSLYLTFWYGPYLVSLANQLIRKL